MTTLSRSLPTSVRPTTAPRLLNLGCGTRYHPAWVNLDLNPVLPRVGRHDIAQPLPFPTGSFDAVYHSHVLEHLLPGAVPPFLRECQRVLRSGGVLRVAVPDLEQIARLYLRAVEAAWQGDAAARDRHRWLVLELYDQATREQPGGTMPTYLRQHPASLGWQRLGSDGPSVRRHLDHGSGAPSGWRQRLRGWLRGSWRERLARRLLGREYGLLQVGRFRRAGEIHHWMYDRVALRDLLAAAGYVDFRCVAAGASAIPGWERYGLDTLADGSAAKPDSLYVEAMKP